MNHIPGLGISFPASYDQPDGEVIGDSVNHKVELDLPGGKVANIGLRIGLEGPADREARNIEFLQTVPPSSLTDSLEREIEALTKQFSDFTGYDKEGQPLMRVTGRDRELLEMKLANRMNALELAQRTRAQAEYVQLQMKAAKQESEQRIEEAAQAKAQELIEQKEIDRRAAQIAARFGVR